MRRAIAIILFAFLSAAFALSQTPTAPGADSNSQSSAANANDQNAIGKMLIQREQESWARRKAGDAAFFQKNIPADFKGTKADGSNMSQADLVEQARSIPMSDYNLSNFKVSFPSADSAVVTYDADYRLVNDDLQMHQKRQITSRWARRDGDWQNIEAAFKKVD